MRLSKARLQGTSLYSKRLHIGMEPVCEAEQSLIAGHLQVKVHIIRGVGVEELPGTP